MLVRAERFLLIRRTQHARFNGIFKISQVRSIRLLAIFSFKSRPWRDVGAEFRMQIRGDALRFQLEKELGRIQNDFRAESEPARWFFNSGAEANSRNGQKQEKYPKRTKLQSSLVAHNESILSYAPCPAASANLRRLLCARM